MSSSSSSSSSHCNCDTSIHCQSTSDHSGQGHGNQVKIRVLPKGYRCGIELDIRGTLLNTLNHVSRQGAPCVQIYLNDKDNTFNLYKFSNEDLRNCKDFCLKKDLNFYVHCPLMSNLALDSCSRVQGIVQRELDTIKDLPASCVLHVGKALELSSAQGLENVAARINELQFQTGKHDRNRYPLLLECAAGQGTELGKDWDQLRKLYEALDMSKVGLCLDTQHLFASGMSDFSNAESIVKLFDHAEDITSRKPSLIHVNDSKKIYGSRVDRHEDIGKGYIWIKEQESLIELMRRCTEDQIDMILETGNQYADLKFMNSLTEKLKD